MTQTLANRMTTNSGQAFVACSGLSIRPEDLNKQTMVEISGELGALGIAILGGAIGGTITVIATNPQQAVEAADWWIDRASEGCDVVGDCVSEVYDDVTNFISDFAEGMTNISYGDGW